MLLTGTTTGVQVGTGLESRHVDGYLLLSVDVCVVMSSNQIVRRRGEQKVRENLAQ